MKAAVLHEPGRPPRYDDFPQPTVREGEALVHVTASALKPVDKQMAEGSHYGSPRELPVVCGLDGVGRLSTGKRVFFAGPRRPYGAMAEQTVVPCERCWPLPDHVDDVTASALANPGMSAWMTLAWRARLAAGERVLVLGATGVTGTLAVQIAALLGAGRVVAAGRNSDSLRALKGMGADAVIHLNEPDLPAAFAREGAFDVVVDYLWGQPTEALLASLTRSDISAANSRVRLIQAGQSAGAAITLPAAALRSSGLEILGSGTGAVPPMAVMMECFQSLMTKALGLRIETEALPLAEVETAWTRQQRQRIVLTV